MIESGSRGPGPEVSGTCSRSQTGIALAAVIAEKKSEHTQTGCQRWAAHSQSALRQQILPHPLSLLAAAAAAAAGCFVHKALACVGASCSKPWTHVPLVHIGGARLDIVVALVCRCMSVMSIDIMGPQASGQWRQKSMHNRLGLAAVCNSFILLHSPKQGCCSPVLPSS